MAITAIMTTTTDPSSSDSDQSSYPSLILSRIKTIQSTPDPFVQDQLQLFLKEWRNETRKEIEELEVLKVKVTQRKTLRSLEEQKMAEFRQKEEELRREHEEEEKLRKEEEKRRRIEEAERKRQKLMEEGNKRNFVIDKKAPEILQQSNREPTPEEIQLMKETALKIRIKPLAIEGFKKERLKKKAGDLWDEMIKLETERYDLEMIKKRQEYDFKELKERQKQQLRHKAMKLGLEPEALMGKYPPKILVASKYERRPGLKPFGETKDFFEGGYVKQVRVERDAVWRERQELFTRKEAGELPGWLGESVKRRWKEEEVKEEEEEVKAENEEEVEESEEEEEVEEESEEEVEVTDEEEDD